MEKPKIAIRPRKNPLLANLPDYLKNPANFETVQKQILATILTTCGHSDILEHAACKKCTEKMLARRKLLKKLGFKNAQQYMAWRAVHEEIKRRMPLVDWKNKKIMTL